MSATTLARFFSPSEQAAIGAAAAAAEARTGGEIVAYVVGRCDAYTGARFRAAAGAAVLAAMAAGLAHQAGEYWGGAGLLWISLPVAAAATVAYALTALVPTLQRWLTSDATLERRVAQRAAEAFLEAEVFATRDRTGVLLFLALLEHRVLVLADSGIKAQVPAQEWRSIADDLAAGVRAGRPAAALIEAIGHCGRLLEERGIARRDDDRDELPDAPRLSDV